VVVEQPVIVERPVIVEQPEVIITRPRIGIELKY
jgi:hypothetical protein